MKVVCINGSPRKEGNTFLTLTAMSEVFDQNGIESEILQVGSGDVKGCIACEGCSETAKCAIPDPQLEEWSDKILSADGIVLAAPAYFGSMPGTMKAFMDRCFFACTRGGKIRGKVGASVAILRRSGGFTTVDDLNRYFYSSEMILVTAPGSHTVHGRAPGEVTQDPEGMNGVRKLAANMSWVLEMIEATKGTIEPPEFTKRTMTNFIR